MKITLSDLDGQIEFGIITVREDEYLAVFDKFRPKYTAQGRRTYEIGSITTATSEHLRFALVRAIGQGQAIAQDIARDLIEDLHPKWLLLIGICGAVPSLDFTLGDVVCATRVHDFCVRAVKAGAIDAFSTMGGPMHKDVEDLLARLPGIVRRLRTWNNVKSIGMMPSISVPSLDSNRYYGSREWQSETQHCVAHHFSLQKSLRRPSVTARPVASSDTLVKDSDLLSQWQTEARAVSAVEMELAGVYVAARRHDREYPILAIRGISDIVGLKREEAWTSYACNVASAFALALVKSGEFRVANIESTSGSTLFRDKQQPRLRSVKKIRDRYRFIEHHHDNDEDQDIRDFFVETDQFNRILEQILVPNPNKNILVIRGVGCIGKSWMARNIRVCCQDKQIPVSLIKADLVTNQLDILLIWTKDLNAREGVPFPSYEKISEYHDKLKMDVQEQGKKAFGDSFVLEKASNEWLSAFLSDGDIELLQTPYKNFTAAFLSDLRHYNRSVVLLWDTYEKTSETIDKWLGDITCQISHKVQMVILGQTVPKWGLGWLKLRQLEELRAMTDEDIGLVIQKYCGKKSIDEQLNQDQINTVTEFARGQPMVASGALQIWADNPSVRENIKASKGDAISDFSRLLFVGIPDELVSIIKALSTVRRFDKAILRALTGLLDIDEVYEKVRRYTFVQPLENGFALHDSIRKLVEDELKLHDPERYKKLHQQAANYFENCIKEREGNGKLQIFDSDQIGLIVEKLFHRVRADDVDGLELVRTTIITNLRQYNLALCDNVLTMLRISEECSVKIRPWAEYITIWLKQSRSSWEEGVDSLQKLILKDLPPQLEIEVRWNLGYSLDYAGDREQAMQEFSTALKLLKYSKPEDWATQVRILIRLGALQGGMVSFVLGYKSLTKAVRLARKIEDITLLADSLDTLNYHLQRYDYFDRALPILKELVRIADKSGDKRERGLAYTRLGELLIAMHDYSEVTEKYIDEAIPLLKQIEDIQSLAWARRNKGMLLMARGEPASALQYLIDSVDGYRVRKSTRGLFRSLVSLCQCRVALGEYEKVRQLSSEVEEWSNSTKLGDYTARWIAVQIDVGLLCNPLGLDRKVIVLDAAEKYFTCLQMGIKESCSLLYELADHAAARIKWLKVSGHPGDASFIAEYLIKMWSKVSSTVSNKDSCSSLEMSKCQHLHTLSVPERIKAALQ